MPIWLPKWHSSADDMYRASLPEAAVRPQTDPELAHHSSQGEAYRLVSVTESVPQCHGRSAKPWVGGKVVRRVETGPNRTGGYGPDAAQRAERVDIHVCKTLSSGLQEASQKQSHSL